MFSWICPSCGHDNPPSAVVCASCGARFDEEPAPSILDASAHDENETATPAPAAPSAGFSLQPGRATSHAAPASQSRARVPERLASSGIPTWLLTILCFCAIAGIGSVIYFGITYFRSRKQATSTGLDPAANVARTKLSNPLQKSVEVVGIRILQDAKKKPEVRFVVVNHSPNELDDLSATVTLWASTSRSEEDSVGTFTFKVPALTPYSAKELNSPLVTKLKFYELPDWQNATPEIEITSP